MRGWDSRKMALLIIFYNGVRERERWRGKMDYSSHYASSKEFIVLLQEQARKLSDKKINCILLDPYKCCSCLKIPSKCAENAAGKGKRRRVR